MQRLRLDLELTAPAMARCPRAGGQRVLLPNTRIVFVRGHSTLDRHDTPGSRIDLDLGAHPVPIGQSLHHPSLTPGFGFDGARADPQAAGALEQQWVQ